MLFRRKAPLRRGGSSIGARDLEVFRTSCRAFPARLQRLLRRAEMALSPHQHLLLPVMLLGAMGLGALLLFETLRLLVPSATTGPGSTLVFDGQIRETSFPESRYRPAPRAMGAATTPALKRPRLDWADRGALRRAASLLELSGDHQGALDLLPPEDPDREKLLQVTPSHHQAVLSAIEELVPLEEARLPPPAKPHRVESAAPREIILGLRRRLPETLLYRVVVNLHCALREKTGASDAHLKLVLESSFPPNSPAQKLYLATKSLERIAPGQGTVEADETQQP